MPKTNIFAFTVYEESNPFDMLIDFLTIYHFAAVVSPLHDSDTWTKEDVANYRKSVQKQYGIKIGPNDETWERPSGELVKNNYGGSTRLTETVPVPKVGERKKPHRHVFIQFDYSVPLQTALGKVAPLDIYYLEVVMSRKAYIRYMCHLDNPEKHRYDVRQVVTLGGVDISCLFVSNGDESVKADEHIYKVIRENHVRSLTYLVEILRKTNMLDCAREVKAHHYYWVSYMKDLTFKDKAHGMAIHNTDNDLVYARDIRGGGGDVQSS